MFHPNIAPHAICVGDHWGAGESLESIIIRIGEMLAYQSYNVKSPLNGEAARWVEENKHRVPLDTVSLLPEENSQIGVTNPTAASATPPEPPAGSAGREAHANHVGPKQESVESSAATLPPKIQVKCPQCATQYRVLAEHVRPQGPLPEMRTCIYVWWLSRNGVGSQLRCG